MMLPGRRAARIAHVLVMPGIGILAADALQVRANAPGAEEKGMVVLVLAGPAPLAVAQHLGAHGADHLRVTADTALTDVDVPPCRLERRQWRHTLEVLRAQPGAEHGGNLDQPADGDRDGGEYRHGPALGLDDAPVETIRAWGRS